MPKQRTRVLAAAAALTIIAAQPAFSQPSAQAGAARGGGPDVVDRQDDPLGESIESGFNWLRSLGQDTWLERAIHSFQEWAGSPTRKDYERARELAGGKEAFRALTGKQQSRLVKSVFAARMARQEQHDTRSERQKAQERASRDPRAPTIGGKQD